MVKDSSEIEIRHIRIRLTKYVPGGTRTLTYGFGGRYAIHCATGTCVAYFTMTSSGAGAGGVRIFLP